MKHDWQNGAPHTYFLECDGHGLIKIGCSARSVHLRIRALQQCSPFDLVCIGMIAGDENTETEMHQRFKAHRFRSEWFHDCPEIREYLDIACPQFDYAMAEYAAFRMDLSGPLRNIINYNQTAKEAMNEICHEAGIRYWRLHSWMSGTAYATPEMIWCAEQFFARGFDQIPKEPRKYSTKASREAARKKWEAEEEA